MMMGGAVHLPATVVVDHFSSRSAQTPDASQTAQGTTLKLKLHKTQTTQLHLKWHGSATYMWMLAVKCAPRYQSGFNQM